MLRRSLAAAALVVAAAAVAPVQAQMPLLDIRIGAQAAMPSGDFADGFDSGLGAYARVGVPLGLTKLFGSVTYTSFKPAGGGDNESELTVQAGPHFSLLPMLDFGIEGAYFSESEEFGMAPNISVGLLKFEATASYNTTFADPKASWISVGVGIRF